MGDSYTDPERILGFVWEGATVAGDRVEIRCPQTNALLWPARAVDVQTYAGLNMGANGVHATYGFKATVLQSGRVAVYLREE